AGGDVDIVEDLGLTLDRVKSVCSERVESKKRPIMAGGEHSITKAAAEALPKDTGLVSFAAPLDLRDEFLGEKLSHATFMRRVSEQLGPHHIMDVGIHAFSKPESAFSKKYRIPLV